MKNKKIIIGIVLFLTIISVTYYIYKDNNTSKSILKENNNVSNTIAVYIKDENGNYQESEQIPQEGYQLNNEKSTCSNGVIPGWDTKNHRFYTDNLTKSGTSCYLYFDELEASQITLDKLGLTANIGTPDFTQVATTDEGILAAEDGMYGGTSYYWRGAVTNNYVKFAGFCWRAIRINGDGSLRIIYDGTTCHQNGESTTDSIALTSQAYNSSYNRSEYVGYTYTEGSQRGTTTSSNLKSQTDIWYTNNITGTNADKVADGKFCNDRDMAPGYSWSSQTLDTFYYLGKERLQTQKAPILNCSNTSDVYTLKVGAITVDEVAFAGGVYVKTNSSYYLYNGQYFWTMSPYLWNGGRAAVFRVYDDGRLVSPPVDSASGIRPVINLRSDITFSSGNGTLDNPYIVAD